MTDQQHQTATAEIIPFPAPLFRVQASVPLTQTAPVSATQRLTTAVAALQLAVAEQQVAVERWRTAMQNLAGTMQTLSSRVPTHGSAPHAS